MNLLIVTNDPNIPGGIPVLAGTRALVTTFFTNVADGLPSDVVNDSNPSLKQKQAIAALPQAPTWVTGS